MLINAYEEGRFHSSIKQQNIFHRDSANVHAAQHFTFPDDNSDDESTNKKLLFFLNSKPFKNETRKSVTQSRRPEVNMKKNVAQKEKYLKKTVYKLKEEKPRFQTQFTEELSHREHGTKQSCNTSQIFLYLFQI